MLHADPRRVYLVIQFLTSLLRITGWVVTPVYYVLTVHMNPLQLVLAGTAFELAIFCFQVPTGVVADVYSRKLSLLIGLTIEGVSAVFRGLVPLFPAILAADSLVGVGEAFQSGALTAWLADEVGDEEFAAVLVRGTQASQVGSFVGMFLGVGLASVHLNLPIVLAGLLFLPLVVSLAVAMPETHFRPVAPAERHSWRVMLAPLRDGVKVVRGSRLLLIIMAIAAIYGASKEGVDRLWEAHFLRDIGLPSIGSLKPVVWFGILGAAGLLLTLAAAELPRRRLDMESHVAVTRVLLATNVVVIAGMVGFGLAPGFALAAVAFLVLNAAGTINGMLSEIWLNQQIEDSRIRATVLSIGSQAHSFGEWAGGPFIGPIGTASSIRAALTVGGLLLVPALGLYGWALRHEGPVPLPDQRE
jgi:DHA3 family tetracycline resistance protein-like MFS transporter